jgi:hypothetical protein
VAEGARLESVYTLTGIGGSNPSLSASILNTIRRGAAVHFFDSACRMVIIGISELPSELLGEQSANSWRRNSDRSQR